jgi:hypothetical protein
MPEFYAHLSDLEARIARTAFYHCQLTALRGDTENLLRDETLTESRRGELQTLYTEQTRICNNLYDELRRLTSQLPEMPPSAPPSDA